MAAKFLPNHRLASAEPRPGSLYAMSMEKSEWALHTGVLYPVGNSQHTLNFPLPFRPGDLLYNPNRPEAAFCGGVFVAAQTDFYCHRLGFFQRKNQPDKIILLLPRIMDCEYYPAEALTERHRLLSLLSEFLKEKQCSWNFCRDFTRFLTGYHDLLLPPPADSEEKTGGMVIQISSGLSPAESGLAVTKLFETLKREFPDIKKLSEHRSRFCAGYISIIFQAL